jgi:DNA polymerase-3 subunit alpha
MTEVLKETYGLMVFQESLMKISQVLAGFTGGQADTLRKVVGKKKPELIKKERLDDLFVEGCVKNGVSEEIAKKIFDQICYFAGYGFNRSHSAAYAFIAYQCAWLKIYYPLEFMCNLLSSEINNNDKNEKLNAYLEAASDMKVIVKLPHINKSGMLFQIEREGDTDIIRYPLTALKSVGSKAVADIVQKQPFKSLHDFVSRVENRVVNSRVFKTLVDYGCMDGAWRLKREDLLAQYDTVRDKIEKEKKERTKQKKYMNKFQGQNVFGKDFNFRPKPESVTF